MIAAARGGERCGIRGRRVGSMALDDSANSTAMRIYDFVNPMDFRYYGADPALLERLRPYVSEVAFLDYQKRVEETLVLAFFDCGWCSKAVAHEIQEACRAVTAEEVYEEEKTTGHVVRALVNCIARRVSPDAARFVHLFATSADATDTANALRFQDLMRDVILPDLVELQSTLIGLAERHAATPQVGRTHGRHAVPITFGFAMALYVDRLGGRIEFLERARQNLRGKLSGAVGAYNALSLQLPRSAPVFEKLVLSYLGLQPAPGSIASQVVESEFVTDLGYAVQSCFSVLANLADDIRHLHRSEIAEVQEEYSAETVGSSTMPHKLNPKNFENVKSLWKAYMPRMVTLFMDQISEHQRDLTNSASQRYLPELFTALDYCTVRLTRALRALRVNEHEMRRNLDASKEQFVAEPLYILLALAGYPEAYEQVRRLARETRERRIGLMELARHDQKVGPWIKKLKPEHLRILEDPAWYTGQARERTLSVCGYWRMAGRQLLDYLSGEREVLASVKTERLNSLHDQMSKLESGKADPEALWLGEDRKTMIEAWISEAKERAAMRVG
jgi:adenylosuccinate lyase